jgi:hypothetical protein
MAQLIDLEDQRKADPSSLRAFLPQRSKSESAGAKERSVVQEVKRANRRADRDPLLRPIPSDQIDRLDTSTGSRSFHHGGPFDAALLARQVPGKAPVDALQESITEALHAVPKTNIQDSLLFQRPLDGFGMIPPGMHAPNGQLMDYHEDIFFSTSDTYGERADKFRKMHRRIQSENNEYLNVRDGIELGRMQPGRGPETLINSAGIGRRETVSGHGDTGRVNSMKRRIRNKVAARSTTVVDI